MASTLKEKVSSILADSANDQSGYDEAVAKLREMAEAIQDALGEPFSVRLEPGYRTNLGQQFKIGVRLADPVFSDILFRAYVPPDGYPVTLDLLEDEHPACRDAGELEQTLLVFLDKQPVKDQLKALRGLAAGH